MMKPIEFRKGSKINLNLLKSEIDRQINVITLMVKGMKPQKSSLRQQKCNDVTNTYCQTQESHLPLVEIPNLFLSNTPSMKSIKSPTNAKRSASIWNKENQVIQSFSITSKSNKLNPIEESQNQALKTSRCKLQSEKKKVKKINLNRQSSKKSYKASGLKKKTIESTSLRDDISEVITSFQSARKANLTEKKHFQNFSSRNLNKFTTAQKPLVNFSVNSSIYDLSKSNSKMSIRKSSVNFNDSFVMNSSSNIHKKPSQSLSTNNISSTFVSDYLIGDSSANILKRLIIGQEVKANMKAQFETKLENLRKKPVKQPKINNVRSALLKRLQQKYQKAVQVTK